MGLNPFSESGPINISFFQPKLFYYIFPEFLVIYKKFPIISVVNLLYSSHNFCYWHNRPICTVIYIISIILERSLQFWPICQLLQNVRVIKLQLFHCLRWEFSFLFFRNAKYENWMPEFVDTTLDIYIIYHEKKTKFSGTKNIHLENKNYST